PGEAIRLYLSTRAAECGICYESYKESAGGQVPKLLWCCHSVCLACLGRLVCQNGTFSFVVCPFCRMVTLVPEGGLPALRNDEAVLQVVSGQVEVQEDHNSFRVSTPDPGTALDFNYSSPVFTVSGFVPAYARAIHPGVGMWGRERNNCFYPIAANLVS
uniref:RING-type domain-containing protein n=1 Tax=Anolis carolinensis TaxID=28377 RepID=A0A803U0J3_ANOCA